MYYEPHRGTSCRKKKRSRSVWRLLFAAVFAVLLLFAAFSTLLEAVVSDVLDARATDIFTAAMADAVYDSISGDDADDMISLVLDGDGRVVSLETDTAAVNLLKADISKSAQRAITEYQKQPQSLSLGTLSGIELLAGRGPQLDLQVELRGAVRADISCSLSEAGINQTRHSISCVVTAKVYVIIPGCRLPLELSTTVLLAESVIVGEVPEAFTYVVGDKSDTIGRIFDYGMELEN